MQLFRAHYSAPNHTLTSTELADAAGYKGWQGANLQYGLLGKSCAMFSTTLTTMAKSRMSLRSSPNLEAGVILIGSGRCTQT